MACGNNDCGQSADTRENDNPFSKGRLRERLFELDELIQSGVSSVTVDGTTTKFDIGEARKERDLLLVRLGYKKRRPLFTSIKSSGV